MLGDTPGGVQRRVLVAALRLAAVGSLLGLVAGFWLLRSLGSMLYGISATDPVVLGVAVLGMGAIALIAAAAPAWRASATDPMTLLRRT